MHEYFHMYRFSCVVVENEHLNGYMDMCINYININSGYHGVTFQ